MIMIFAYTHTKDVLVIEISLALERHYIDCCCSLFCFYLFVTITDVPFEAERGTNCPVKQAIYPLEIGQE